MEIVYERRYYAFKKGVRTPFKQALLRLLKRHYYFFLKGIITPFYAYRHNLTPFHFALYHLFRVITPFRKALYYLLTLISTHTNMILIGFRKSTYITSQNICICKLGRVTRAILRLPLGSKSKRRELILNLKDYFSWAFGHLSPTEWEIIEVYSCDAHGTI